MGMERNENVVGGGEEEEIERNTQRYRKERSKNSHGCFA